ncbi:MAG: hypothetical protein UZ05_CHB002002905 [Chlorobi bacterium OLB5]|nr:MAG: hypothetical protein UZ05_CHB002002905 [Chlorobi bacterium OLB5]
MLKYLLILIFIIMSKTAFSQNNADMQKLLWIVDKWVSQSETSTSYEHWEKTNETLYTGGSETIKNGDTVFAEKLKIELIEGKVYYIADVAHNPAPVKFLLTEVNENSAIFENPEHDFPQKITYINENGILHAVIEGPGKDGKTKKSGFFYAENEVKYV